VGQESICGMIKVLPKNFPVKNWGKTQNSLSGYLQCQQLSQDSKQTSI